MSASWKNPFMKEKGQNEDSPKARVSCEAIPEEMTPPDPPVPIPAPELRLDVGLSVDVAVRPVRGPSTTGEIGRVHFAYAFSLLLGIYVNHFIIFSLFILMTCLCRKLNG